MELFRAEGLLDLEAVRRQKLIFIGGGSLGSLTLANLAYPWRQIVLIDPDELAEHNVERHLLGRSEIGQPKVEGLKRWLIDRGVPSTSIVTHHGVAQDVLDEHTDASLMVVSIDRKFSKDDVNAWAYLHNIPALYGGVYPKGTGGNVIVIPRPAKACYVCAAFMIGESLKEEPTEVGEVDYGVDVTLMRDEEGEVTAVPALKPSIGMVADTMALLAIDCLKGVDDVNSQVVVMVGSSWETVIVAEQKDNLESIVQYINTMKEFKVLPNMRLRVADDGTQMLDLRYGTLSLLLKKWRGCPIHSAPIDASDI